MKALALRGLACLLALGACGGRDDRPVRVVVIGEAPRIVDPNVQPVRAADAVLINAAAQGLVRLDNAGQIVPGLAERWSVSDDGLSYIFRIGDARLPNGTRVGARAIVRQLRSASAPRSRNALAGVLTGIEEIVATNDVIEIRLVAPRPNLLHHLARPEFAIVQRASGTGPFRVAREGERLLLSRTVPDGEDEREERAVLGAARAALAVALFEAAEADLVLGGTSDDLPVMQAADPPPAARRVQPTAGLFGLTVVDVGGPLADAAARRALAMAVDRAGIVAALDVVGLAPRAGLAPAGLSNLPAPVVPYWANAPLAARQVEARRLLAGARPQVRVAMRNGPGDRLLFAHLRRDWALIGVRAVRVGYAQSADLRILDEVAPSPGASWYLERFACGRARVCDAGADAAIKAARTARDSNVRTGHFAEADRLLNEAGLFIALTPPVRWALASRRVPGFRTNPFAAYSLTGLADGRAR